MAEDHANEKPAEEVQHPALIPGWAIALAVLALAAGVCRARGWQLGDMGVQSHGTKQRLREGVHHERQH